VSLPQVLRNVWRLCHHYVDPSCLLKSDADICVFQDIQRILAGQQQEQQESRSMSKGTLAGIVAAGKQQSAKLRWLYCCAAHELEAL
jgi:hypothetical protein